MERHAHFVVPGVDAVEPVDEIHMPGGAPELAVRRRRQADVLLHADDRTDRVVFGRTELGLVDASRCPLLACGEEGRRAEEAADVVGAEGELSRITGSTLSLALGCAEGERADEDGQRARPTTTPSRRSPSRPRA